MRRILPAVLFAAAAVIITSGCGGSSDSDAGGDTGATTAPASADALAGSVGPGFEISMAPLETAAGAYTLVVDDQSADHNFHLTGPGGVDVATDVAATGEETFTVDLEEGTYTFVCDPHASSMKGTLTVG